MPETMPTRPNQEPITPEFVHTLVENAHIVISEDEIFNKLKSAEETGRQLRIKMGFDPTSPDLHLGHAVAMHQLRRFQDLGHLPVIIIGDYTGRIGDPSGRNKSRPLATPEELEKNAETYIEQLGRVLDIERIEVHRNSEWLEGMNLADVIGLISQGTLSQIISRDDFRKRLDEGSPIALHEIIYPYLQGKDSLAVNADIEVGGVDQLYAFQAGRSLQGNRGDDPQSLVMMPLLRGLDGHKKMSKSLHNYIGLTDQPNDMFGKVMSIPDALLEEYLKLASTFTAEEISQMVDGMRSGLNPMDVKARLAHNITTLYHSEAEAESAAQHFSRQFREKDDSNREYRIVKVAQGISSLVDVLIVAGVVDSKSKARRMISDGAVRVNGEKISPDASENMSDLSGMRIRAGRRNFIQLQTEDEQ